MISRRLVQFRPSDKPKTSQTRGPEMASSVEVGKGLRYPWQLQRHRASNEGYRDLSEEVTQAYSIHHSESSKSKTVKPYQCVSAQSKGPTDCSEIMSEIQAHAFTIQSA